MEKANSQVRHEPGDGWWFRFSGIVHGYYDTRAEAEAEYRDLVDEAYAEAVAVGMFPDTPSLPPPHWEAR